MTTPAMCKSVPSKVKCKCLGIRYKSSFDSNLPKSSTVSYSCKTSFSHILMVLSQRIFLKKEIHIGTSHKKVRFLINDFFQRMERIFYCQFSRYQKF